MGVRSIFPSHNGTNVSVCSSMSVKGRVEWWRGQKEKSANKYFFSNHNLSAVAAAALCHWPEHVFSHASRHTIRYICNTYIWSFILLILPSNELRTEILRKKNFINCNCSIVRMRVHDALCSTITASYSTHSRWTSQFHCAFEVQATVNFICVFKFFFFAFRFLSSDPNSVSLCARSCIILNAPTSDRFNKTFFCFV